MTLFTTFGVDVVARCYGRRDESRLYVVGCTLEPRRFYERWPFSVRKAVFRHVKGRILHGKMRPFVMYWMSTCYTAYCNADIPGSLPLGGLGWVLGAFG